MHKDWVKANCNEDSAYSQGVEDAENGKKHDAHSYSACADTEIGKIKKAYSKGYQSVSSNPIHAPKEAFGMNEYTCRVRPFGHEYSFTSTNKVEAYKKVKTECEASNHSMHCDEIECEKVPLN